MWLAIRAFLSGVSVAVLRALGKWLATEAARFAAEYSKEATAAIKRVAEDKSLTGDRERFDLACKLLVAELKRKGVAEKNYLIQGAVQTAFGVVKEEWEKAQKKG